MLKGGRGAAQPEEAQVLGRGAGGGQMSEVKAVGVWAVDLRRLGCSESRVLGGEGKILEAQSRGSWEGRAGNAGREQQAILRGKTRES